LDLPRQKVENRLFNARGVLAISGSFAGAYQIAVLNAPFCFEKSHAAVSARFGG
jgi:hypothetical protein